MKNNILFFFQHLHPYPGACAMRSKSLLEPFTKKKIEGVRILTTIPSNTLQYPQTVVHLKKLSNDSTGIRRLIHELNGSLSVCVAFLKMDKPSLMIISSPSYFMMIGLSTICLIKNIRFTLDIRDLYPNVFTEAKKIKKSNLFYILLDSYTNYLYRKSSIITTTNERISRNIKNRLDQADKNKVYTIFNGFPDSLINYNSRKFKKFTICFHGVLGEFQEISLLSKLISSYENSNDIQFVVIGYGSKQNLISEIQQPNLRFFGKLNNTHTLRILSKCHLGLSLRVDNEISKNSFPVKNWEYLGAGIPSINYPESEASAFCEKHEIGFTIKSTDSRAFVEQINKLKSDKNLYEKMSQNNKKIRIKYTRERAGENFYNILSEKCLKY